MLIRDLEQKTGLDRATIRYYEREGMIAPVRQENGYREYLDSDCETLLKVKLLRQLGMPLHRIKGLQQGSEEFSLVLDEQINTLERNINSSIRAKEICQQMRTDGTDFDTLDAQFYLTQLSQPRLAPKEFSEGLRAEKHPWRRYLARMIDILLVTLFVQFLVIVVLRIRPYNFGIVVGYLSLILCVPIFAACLHWWGTTPGKFVFGLRVESVNEGKLSWKDAMWREFNALRYGMGYNIPIYSEWRCYKNYKQYMKGAVVEYDEDCEYFYDIFDRKKKLQLAALLMAAALLLCINVCDEAKPTNRGDLTIPEFVENYNDNHSILEKNDLEIVRKMEITGNMYQEDFFEIAPNMPLDRNLDFQFHMEEGNIHSITYENTWEDPFGFTPLDNERFLVAYTLAASQNNFSYYDMQDFINQYREKMYEEATEGTFTYKNVCVEWEIETEYTAFHAGTYFSRSNEEVSGKTSKVHLRFSVTLLDE